MSGDGVDDVTVPVAFLFQRDGDILLNAVRDTAHIISLQGWCAPPPVFQSVICPLLPNFFPFLKSSCLYHDSLFAPHPVIKVQNGPTPLDERKYTFTSLAFQIA